MISIQTNVNSLVAQQNLSVNNTFQSQTIQRLTSGYRINSSGDDAAGLAVANKYRSGVAELTQGVANGNDGVAQLQIMDGGMNNIAQMLDRLKTLAMQSASGTFTGDRATLNSEFQTDIGEIDRQAQSIGLNTGGNFAKSLAVYLGSGSGSQGTANSVVTVDLSKATVDSTSLGLAGYQAVNAAVAGDTVNLPNNYDLSNSNATTNVGALMTANSGTTTFGYKFTGPGFGDANGITVSVDTTTITVNDTASLVNALNAAIQKAAAQAGGAAQAFKAAGITASIHTDANGREQLAFNSSNTAFQVAAQDALANAFLGNFNAATQVGNATNTVGSDQVAQGSLELGTAGSTGTSGIHANTVSNLAMSAALSGTQNVTISVNDPSGVAHGITVAFNSASGTAGSTKGDTVAAYLKAINAALQGSNDSYLQQVTAVADATTSGVAGNVNFISTLKNFSVTVTAASTSGGLATKATTAAMQVGSGGTADVSTMTGAQAAVAAITSAVTLLGASQAAVGKGENVLNYAISLAQSQITNFSAAQSYIRDANVAAEAANLSKAQVLQQSSIAAMAQANSAPQAILALLKA